MYDATITLGQATSDVGNAMPNMAVLTLPQRSKAADSATALPPPSPHITGSEAPKKWPSQYQSAHYLSSTAHLRASPRRSPRDRVMPPHLVSHHFFFGLPDGPGHGSILQPLPEGVSDVPEPSWGLRSTELRRNRFNLAPGETSTAERDAKEKASAQRARDAAEAAAAEQDALNFGIASPRAGTPSRLNTPARMARRMREQGDVHARLVAASRIKQYHEENGRLPLRKPGFLQLSAMGRPSPRPWCVGGIRTDYSPRIPTPRTEPPLSGSIMDSLR